MKAVIAGMVSTHRRGTAYGIFNAGYGVFWFLGSALMGVLYDISLFTVALFSVVAQIVALFVLLSMRKEI